MNAPEKTSRFVAGPALARDRQSVRAVLFGRRRIAIVVTGVLIVVLLVWLLSSGGKTHRPTGFDEATQPVPVGVATAKRADIRVTRDALGAVTPLATVVVKPEVSGILKSINFKEGQMVHAGDVLAEIDPRPYQAALDQAKGALARDEAQYENAQIDLKRYQTLWAQKAISQQILATQEALVRTDAGTVEADRGALEAAAVNLGFCKITSPVAGRVGLRQVDIGNYVQVGVTTEIVAVTQVQPISVLFTVPEDDVPVLNARVHSGADIAVEAYDRAQQTRVATGRLSNMDNEVDPTTGTVKIRAMFDNSDGHLFPQQFVNVKILLDTLHDQTAVPAAAVQHGASGDFVFLVRPGQTVAMRSVALGTVDGDTVDVERGLSTGDVVVVDGADRLRDGSRVSIGGSRFTGARTGKSSGGHRGHHHHAQAESAGDGGR
jgi:multidrug efflux system membrane fusion protein